MEKYPFLLDSAGYCFLCLKRKEILPIIKCETGGVRREVAQNVSRTFSFRNICQYLKTDLKDIFGEAVPQSSRALSGLEQTEMKGTLCEECAPHCETFSRIFLELEVLQMKLSDCLKTIHKVLADADKGDGQDLEKFSKEMWKRPETLLQYGIVERLRKHIFSGSSLLIAKSRPRVVLTKLPKVSRTPVMSEAKPLVAAIHQRPPTSVSVHGGNTRTPIATNSESDVSITNYSRSNTQSGVQDSNDAQIPQPDSSDTDDEFVRLECDICHLKVSDLSTHLYTVHFEAEDLEEPPNANVEVEPMEWEAEKPSMDNATQLENMGGPGEPSITNVDASNSGTVCSSQPSSQGQNKKFKCYLCENSYRKKSNLTSHQQMVHFGFKCQCQFCFDWFSSRLGLNRHMKVACPVKNSDVFGNREAIGSGSDPPIIETTAPKLLECEICHKYFISHQARTRHHNEDHEGNKFGCDLCHETFFIRSYKYTHRKKCPARQGRDLRPVAECKD